LTVSDVTVGEDEGTAVFTVELAPVSSVATTFDVATEDGAAVAREDFVGVAAGVSIPAGEASVPVVVTLLDDYTVEPYRESFGLALSGAANARIGTPSATGTILDDDTPSVPVPGGLVLHLDASALVGVLADGEATTTWPDTSGVGNDAVTDAGSPIWYEQGIGGRPAFWFDGVDATFVAPSIRPESGAVSVYIISEKDAADGGNYQRLTACDSGEANDWTMPNWAINGYPSGAVGGAPAAYPARLDSRQYPDGRGIGPIRLARQATTAGGWFRGDIAEMLVYDRYLTAEEHALVSSWLEAKYAVAGFSVAPSLVVQGLGQTIASGDTSPDAADGTDFGETVGNHVFEVRNLGTDALTISSINVDSTHFTLAPPDPLTVAPGAVATFSVAFAPTVQGSYAATVTIISNDADSPYTFAVRGEKTTSVLDVEFGTGDGSYAEGASVGIVADTRPGRTFANWVVSPPEFADNLSKALSDRTDFSMPDRDVTVTATYTLDAPQWSVTLNVTNGQPESLQFGMHEAASDGFDEGLDLGVPTPGVGEACLASEDLVLTLASDYRAVGETAEFLLVANAPVGEPLTVAWAVSGLPAQTCLSLYEVEWDGSAWIPVGSTAIDMATTTACVVPAGETRRLAIRFGGELVYDLAL
jgi:hypothetical protein